MILGKFFAHDPAQQFLQRCLVAQELLENFLSLDIINHFSNASATSSGLIIVQYIANRLRDLRAPQRRTARGEHPAAQRKKVEEYETRNASLEYQLDLLKRQLGGELVEAAAATPAAETFSMLIYNPWGEVLRVECPAADLTSHQVMTCASSAIWGSPSASEGHNPAQPPRLLAPASFEELLFLFNSGLIPYY